MCIQISVADWSESKLVTHFSRAIRESRRDLANPTILEAVTHARADVDKTDGLLASWLPRLDRDPRAFIDVYSGVVVATDAASAQFLATLSTSVESSMPPHHHLAQYLLRTNAALGLSESMPYHPHSHRLDVVCHKLRAPTAHLAASLVRAAELGSRSAETSDLVRLLPGFRYPESDLPLVLAVALAAARRGDPESVLEQTLALRGLPQAVRYRHWINRLLTEVETAERIRATAHDIEAHRHAKALLQNVQQELSDARRLLAVQLGQIHERRGRHVLERTAGFASSAAVGGITGPYGALHPAAAEARGPSVLQQLKDLPTRRRVAFLVRLARDGRGIDDLNFLLARVFGAGLGDDELEKLRDMRARQYVAIDGVFGRE